MSVVAIMGRTRGFTLIEIVVSLAVLALLAGVVFQVLSLANQGWSRVTQQAGKLDEVGRVQGALRHVLTRMRPLQDADACGGDTRELRFFAPGAIGHLDDVTYEYRLTVERGQGGDALRLSGCPLFRTDALCSESVVDYRSETLVSGLGDIEFRYLVATATGQGWQQRWSDCSSPPKLVNIRVGDAGNASDTPWIPFFVRPRLDVSADCVFDPVGRRCRPD